MTHVQSRIRVGDEFEVETERGYAVIRVSKILGERVYYEVVESDGLAYGTDEQPPFLSNQDLAFHTFTMC